MTKGATKGAQTGIRAVVAAELAEEEGLVSVLLEVPVGGETVDDVE